MNARIYISLVTVFILTHSSTVGAATTSVIDAGKKVKMHFTAKIGEEILEDTKGKEPYTFTYGQDKMIPGVEEAVKGLKAGDKKHLTLAPDKAFGQINLKAVGEFQKTQFPTQDIQQGMVFRGKNKSGLPLQGIVKEVKKDTIVIDFNHPLAGKTMDVDFEIIEVV